MNVPWILVATSLLMDQKRYSSIIYKKHQMIIKLMKVEIKSTFLCNNLEVAVELLGRWQLNLY